MSTVIRDMWPEVIDMETVALPGEILEYQAQRVEERTKGFLKANILHTVSSEQEVLLSFELTAPSLDFSSILFKVRHRLELEYPALIIPPEPLPSFLQPTIRVEKLNKGYFGSAPASVRPFDERVTVDKPNHWLATSDTEFSDKVGEVLQSPAVTSIVANLLAKTHRIANPPLQATLAEPT